jgi:hypothetical protein
MNIKAIEIKNYKCHKRTSIPVSSNLHTFVGPNSAGKTSIIEACRLARRVGNTVEYGSIVYGGISKGVTPPTVEIKFVVELSPEERNYYFSEYFFLSSELIEAPTATKILSKVSFTFSTQSVKGSIAEMVLTEVAISDVYDREFIPVLVLTDDRSQIAVSDFKPGILGRINNNPYVNEYLKALKKNTFNLNSVPKEAFQSRIWHDFLALLRFILSYRETDKQVNSKYFEDFSNVDEEGSDLISMMVTMFLNKGDQFNEVEDVCKRLFPEIETIHPRQIAKDVYTLGIKKKNIPNEIILEHEGTGMD